MIGTGVFTTTGLMAEMGAGSGDILLAWLLGGVIAVCGAFCYGEVGANLPHSGGEYYYLSRLLHPAVGFMSGVVSLVVGFAGPIAAAALALNLYVERVIADWPVRASAATMIVALSLLHAYDLRLGSRFQTAITVLKVGLIAAFIGGVMLAVPAARPELLTLNTSFLTSSPFAVVLIYASFAYAGWNAAAYIGTELKTPQHTLPRSLVMGTAGVTALYLLLNLCYLLVAPPSELAGSAEVGYVVGARLWGVSAANVISMLIALTLLCPLSAMLMVGPRIAEAMAQDGFLPRSLATLNRRNVPSRAVVVVMVLAALITAMSSFAGLLIYIAFVLNIFSALTVFSLFRLRRENRAQVKVCIGYPVTPLLFLVFTVWMTVWSIYAQPWATLAGVATLAAAYGLYLPRARQARLAAD